MLKEKYAKQNQNNNFDMGELFGSLADLSEEIKHKDAEKQKNEHKDTNTHK